MTSNLALERVIAAHLAEWDAAHVELAIYGVGEPATIARAIAEFCYRELRAAVTGALFYRSIVAFDWDSLCKEPEPALVGYTAHAFCADWSRPNHVQAPTLDEARSFIADYEAARGHPFDSAERRLVGGAFAYSVAYSARCWHALWHDDRREPGNCQYLVATYGDGLLAL